MRSVPLPFLFLLFIIIPLLEIAAFVLIGGEIGVFATLALVFATAIAGSVLLRYQGFGILTRIRRELDGGRVPQRELIHGAMILLAGLMLLLPGFVTDAFGLLLFVPAVRDAVWRFLSSRIRIVTNVNTDGYRGSPFEPDDDGVVDLDESEYSHDERSDSPWKRVNGRK
ncbi:FxsA family protein [Mesorhizobium xinjiangense]|uniref:FxsA family protein n=1 Tax=Mesorhizobium xinjiangense TaxID=2678685 RepID=UPI0012EE2799|nr:FxsA family protein [Mesorhizobium xinjiangense]